MGKKIKTKREKIEELLAAGKTEQEILEATNYDRSYIWNIHQKWRRAQKGDKKDA